MKERELPTGWKWKKIEDVTFFQEGPGLLKSQFRDSGIPFLNIRTLVNERIDKSKCQFLDPTEVENNYGHFLLNAGDIIVSSSGSLGKTAVVQPDDLPIMLNTSVIRFRTKDKSVLTDQFLHIFLKSRYFSKQFLHLKTGTAQLNFGPTHLKQMYLPLPPLSVQRQIVAVLEQAKVVKRQRQEADALTGALLQSVFREMFGDLVRNVREWDIVKLESICTKITDGTHVTPTYIEKGVPFLSVKNLTKGYLDFDDVKYISESEHRYITKRSKPERGDILLTKVGVNYGIAEIVDVETEFSIFVSLALLKPKFEIVDPYYLKHCINSDFVYRQAQNRISGIGVPDLHLIEIKQFEIPLPPLAIQQQFAQIVASVEALREKQRASGVEIEGLFEGLMQRAFAGELVA